jgi:dTDP-4-dehydrorhamnose 3,5-epimerase
MGDRSAIAADGEPLRCRDGTDPVQPICGQDDWPEERFTHKGVTNFRRMNVIATTIPEVLILEPHVYGDHRGFFMESFNHRVFEETTGLQRSFVQDNHSRSRGGILRGLHYQLQCPQGKLLRVVRGEIFDVAVDIRRRSPTFGHWVGVTLSADNYRQLWVPEGFAHGFYVLSELADVIYKTTDYYAPQHERTLLWKDEDLAIDWPIGDSEPILSAKDEKGDRLQDAEVFP